MKKLAFVAALMAAFTTFAAPTGSTVSDTKATAVKALKNVSVAELPAKAAQLVASATSSDREAVAIAVVRTVGARNPFALVSVVASISKTSPELASVVAGTAAAIAPKQAQEIALAAAKAAPSASDKIAAAVATSVPGSAVSVAESLARFQPQAAARIFAAVSAAVPEATPKLANRTSSRAAGSAGALGTIQTTTGPIGTGTRAAPVGVAGETVGSDPSRNYGTGP